MTWAVGPTAEVSTSASTRDRLEDVVQLRHQPVELRIGQAEAGQGGDVLDIGIG